MWQQRERGGDKMQRISHRALVDESQKIKDSPKGVNAEADRWRVNEREQ